MARVTPRRVTSARMRSAMMIAAVLCAVLQGVTHAAGIGDTATADGIATAVDDEIAAGHVLGAVVVVGQGGRIVYRRAFGVRAHEETTEPMTLDTIFDLASLTKVVATTTAVMQLVERGRIDLDTPVARYWPEFRARGKAAITVRELLTHRSGLRADLEGRGWSGYDGALHAIAAERPLAPPNRRFVYSDLNFAALGELVRRLSGQPLDRYCAEHVFGPLGMADTGFTPPPAERARIAPTLHIGDTLLRGTVHDPMARRMSGIAGHAGLFATADDLAVFAQALLDGGHRGDARILTPESVRSMTRAQPPLDGEPRRGLGWDLESAGVGDLRATFAAGAYGHTGYTGTSIWIAPALDAYVILLTNRAYPDDRGDVRSLRARVAHAVAGVLALPGTEVATASKPRAARLPVETGLDVLAAEHFAPIAGQRVGLITNRAARDGAGHSSVDLLRQAPGVTLAAIFTPEHGLDAMAETTLPSRWDPTLLLSIHSLYGATTRPTPAMLDGIDALVFDVQDAGARFYTYETTMGYAMEAASARGLPFFVLDRPDPIDAAIVQGPVLDADLRSFTGYHPLPVRHGMTIGELAALFNEERHLGVDLHVIAMRGYARGSWYDDTGLAWTPPSPNLPTVEAATLYPAVGLVEGANVSVGRGTATPFELVGAPWINGAALASYLIARNVPGVSLDAATFVPRRDAYAGRHCHGVRIHVIDRTRFDAPAFGIEIASALHRLYPEVFELKATLGMIGTRQVLAAISRGDDPRAIAQTWDDDLTAFGERRARFLMY